jgi:hypothetical protein
VPGAGERIVYHLFEEGERTATPTEPAPVEASAEKINEAKKAVRGFSERVRAEGVRVLKSDRGQDLVLQLPKNFTGKLQSLIFKTLTDRYPILEPILGAFVGTIDASLEARTLSAADKIANVLGQNPENAPEVIQGEASKIVEETKINFTSTLTSKARDAIEALRKKGQSIKEVLARLEEYKQRIRDREQRTDKIRAIAENAEEQIKLLSCQNEDLRSNAATKLAEASPYLKQDQVERIQALLGNDDIWLRKSKAYQNRYEAVPVRYYAAQAVRNMRSQYLPGGSKVQALAIIKAEDARPLGERPYLDAKIVEEKQLTAP